MAGALRVGFMKIYPDLDIMHENFRMNLNNLILLLSYLTLIMSIHLIMISHHFLRLNSLLQAQLNL